MITRVFLVSWYQRKKNNITEYTDPRTYEQFHTPFWRKREGRNLSWGSCYVMVVDSSLRDLRNTSYHSAKPSALVDFVKNICLIFRTVGRWHSLSNSFYVPCLLIFFCSVLVIYSVISSFDSCRPVAQLFWHMLKKLQWRTAAMERGCDILSYRLEPTRNEICKLVTLNSI